jgi:hypothetical protein
MPQRRRQQNDRLRREVNDRIAGVAETLDPGRFVFRFLCECDRSACRDVIELTIDEYRALGADRRRVIVPAHHNGQRSLVEAVGPGIYAISG